MPIMSVLSIELSLNKTLIVRSVQRKIMTILNRSVIEMVDGLQHAKNRT
jgi:hypothetical protein